MQRLSPERDPAVNGLGKNKGRDLPEEFLNPGSDTKSVDPIAICGMSMVFPQDATSPDAFWKMLLEKRCAVTDFPGNRLSTTGFYRAEKSRNTISLRGGHFVKESLAAFDANFFSISPTEAAAMDPMQRWLLEVAYNAMENAGITLEQAANTSTGVYTGSFNVDYMLQLNRDPECLPSYAAIGSGLSMLANRISWFYNLRGPSIGLDSACSSTAMATDIACQALQTGACNMALVAGCNLATSPEPFLWMSNLNFLSPDSRCYSFDHRANGYARGEGVAVIVLKRLSDAIRDGNTIRAVIRSTGSNEDGRTPGITQPSLDAQLQLIKKTYEKAGLSLEHTRYFEAHGTGTAVGDPIEAQAIGLAFRQHRSIQDPLYVGAVKSNIGHLEGASGLAAIIKAVLALENGVIPPNANFEKVNEKIDADFLKIKTRQPASSYFPCEISLKVDQWRNLIWSSQFPEESVPWPTLGLRRASINSFGFGGANSHVILDDAYNYLRMRSLPGIHCTKHSSPTEHSAFAHVDELTESNRSLSSPLQKPSPRLLVWSAADKDGIARITQKYRDHHDAESKCHVAQNSGLMDNLAFTLGRHRSHLTWRSFAVLSVPSELKDLSSNMSFPTETPSIPPEVGFVFTGQGAQWYAMGRELISYKSFKSDLVCASHCLQKLGCRWSVLEEELLKPEQESEIDGPEYSQTLCTVLQVALVNLLGRFGVYPSSVLGHSSGEIAAAYAGGHITQESAWKLAYFRGTLSAQLAESTKSEAPGIMMVVGLSQDEAQDLIAKFRGSGTGFGIGIACINSPKNVTISGEKHLIERVEEFLKSKNVFTRKLRVPLAYHSNQMLAISNEYIKMIGPLSAPSDSPHCCPMVSTVTGQRADPRQLTNPSYWASNMVLPVQFAQAMTLMCAQPSASLAKKIDLSHVHTPVADHIVELGPHSALQGPIREILRTNIRGKSIGYDSTLKRSCSAAETMLTALGNLHCIGVFVNFDTINERSGSAGSGSPPSILVDLPEYPFDHSQQYWHESRLSRNYRFRDQPKSELLGVRCRDWNPSEPRWRHFIRLSEMPWIEHHLVNGRALYPGAGMLGMAIEAARQLIGQDFCVESYTLHDVRFKGAMDLSGHGGVLEVQTTLRKFEDSCSAIRSFHFTIQTNLGDIWLLNCAGMVSVQSSQGADAWSVSKTEAYQQSLVRHLLSPKIECTEAVDSQDMYQFLKKCGLEYGQLFQAVHDQRCDANGVKSTGRITPYHSSEQDLVIHPISMDAIMHLSFTGLTSGGSRPMATSVPTRIGHLCIMPGRSSNSPTDGSLTACSTITSITQRDFTCSGIAVDGYADSDIQLESGDYRAVKLWYEGLEMTNVTDTPAPFSLPNPRQYCMNVHCKAALDKMSHQDLKSFLANAHPTQPDSSDSFYLDAERLVVKVLKQLVSCDTINPQAFETREPWKAHYWNWARHHLASGHEKVFQAAEQTPSEEDTSMDALSQRLVKAGPVGRVYVEVASSLVAMFKGEINPLESLLRSGLLKGYYEELIMYSGGAQVASYVDLLAHQTPGLKVLEIGGGTASATRNFIRTLRSQPNDAESSLRCSAYDFTDISAAFLDGAQAEFAIFSSQMSFGTFDVERSYDSQGRQEHFYDLLIADNVLHVTSNLTKTVRNVRKALKRGGKMLLHEYLTPSGWTPGFIFGVFPGWWKGTEEGRVLSPNLTVQGWDLLLRKSGFSGVDLVLDDLSHGISHQLAWIVTTATEEVSSVPRCQPQTLRRALIVTDGRSTRQQDLARELLAPLRQSFGTEPRVLNLEEAFAFGPGSSNADELMIVLVDFGDSFLASLDEIIWDKFKVLLELTRHILWVSAGGGQDASPDHGMLDGLARTLRSESYELHLVTLALELGSLGRNEADRVMLIVREMAEAVLGQAYEQEYIEIDGRLQTRRLVESQQLKSTMNEILRPQEVVTALIADGLQFAGPTAFPTRGQTAYYVRSSTLLAETTDPEDIDIAVKAVLLHTQNYTYSLEHDKGTGLGNFCAGVVVHVGAESTFRPGDRVVALGPPAIQSHIRVASRAALEISDDLSFSEACQTLPLVVSIRHAFLGHGLAKDLGTILVQDGASLIGQASIHLLAELGVKDVWATVSNEEENSWVTQTCGVSTQKILPQNLLVSHPVLTSKFRHKFDVVLGKSHDPHASLFMHLVRPGGRYITFRSSHIKPQDDGHVSCVPENISLLTLCVKELMRKACAEDTQYFVSKVPHCLTLAGPKHAIRQFSASELSKIYDYMQSADHDESILLKFDAGDVVNIRVERQYPLQLDPSATYLISGGLGGLGRTIARWLAERGARHLLLLSRSGPRTSEARELLIELGNAGIQVEAPPCDVSDNQRFLEVLARCSEVMPPIKGCIQASAILTEVVFRNMEFQDWKDAVNPKVNASRNLHLALPKGLDFFVLLSSMMGILGSGSLAAYNAGNTYQDALARYRTVQGEHAVSLNLGAIVDVGHLVEHSYHLDGMERARKFEFTYVKEVCALLDIFCNPKTPLSSHSTTAQALVGIRPVAHWKHAGVVPATMEQPMWGHTHHVPMLQLDSSEVAIAESPAKENPLAVRQKLYAAESVAEAAETASESLARRVSALVGVPIEQVNVDKPMHSYGLDSLSAIELRNWVGQVFEVDLPVFEILNSATFVTAGVSIAQAVKH